MNLVDQMQEPIPKYVLEEVARGLDHRDDYGWIPWAWAVLSGAGDVPVQVDEEIAEYPGHLVTIVGLGHLFDLFQDILSGVPRTSSPMWSSWGEIRPQITTIEIARYCERGHLRPAGPRDWQRPLSRSRGGKVGRTSPPAPRDTRRRAPVHVIASCRAKSAGCRAGGCRNQRLPDPHRRPRRRSPERDGQRRLQRR